MANLVAYIIGAVIAVFVLGAFIGSIADETIGRQNVGNVTGSLSIVLGVVPVILLVGVLWKLFKGAGIGGGK